jgi:hypothetical protein
MSTTLDPDTFPDQPLIYQIRIEGHLGAGWDDWFGGLTITLEDNLKRVRDLGTPLISVTRVQQADASDINP